LVKPDTTLQRRSVDSFDVLGPVVNNMAKIALRFESDMVVAISAKPQA
jgi:hypothetical protein